MASIITFGGKQAQDPAPLKAQCDDQGLPTDDWFGKANRFISPRGREPGTGVVLLTRTDLNALDANSLLTLKIDDGAGTVRTFNNLNIAAPPRCITTGNIGDTAAVYAVTVQDRRGRLAKIPISRGYNVLGDGGNSYLTETLNSGSPWTWQQMVTDLGTVLGGITLTLPYTPDGTPENFRFYGTFAWTALQVVLDQLSMTVAHNQDADTFTVIEVGAGTSATGASPGNGLFWDIDASTVPTLCRLPAKMRIAFLLYPAPTDGSTPYYTIDKDPPGSVTTALISGSVEWVFDNLGALNDGSGTPTNAAALATRATERAAKRYQMLLTGTTPILQRSTGLLPLDTTMQMMAWGDVGDKLTTETYRGPVPAFPMSPATPTAMPGSAGAKIHLYAGVVGDAFSNPYVTDATGIFYWLGTPMEFTQADGDFDSGFVVWFTTPYQTAILGAQGAALPNAGNAYNSVLMFDDTGNVTLVTLDIDLMNDLGGGSFGQPGSGTTHVVTVTAPLFETTQYPACVEILCTSDGSGGFYPTIINGP